MKQRIQTVFLLLAAIAFFLLFEFPFAVSDIANPGFLADKDFDVYDNIILIVLTALGGLIALIAVFLYNNRPLQIRLSYLVIILGILLILVAAILFYNEAANIMDKIGVSDGVGLFMPFLAFICGFLAALFIKKDEKLVRSADRLR
jgi:peptidoglycan/LPS O-acetylase OafA/YrhL